MNEPPTAVGGIRMVLGETSARRQDMNEPPTAVGGIRTFLETFCE